MDDSTQEIILTFPVVSPRAAIRSSLLGSRPQMQNQMRQLPLATPSDACAPPASLYMHDETVIRIIQPYVTCYWHYNQDCMRRLEPY
jgi:hypothetical protein